MISDKRNVKAHMIDTPRKKQYIVEGFESALGRAAEQQGLRTVGQPEVNVIDKGSYMIIEVAMRTEDGNPRSDT